MESHEVVILFVGILSVLLGLVVILVPRILAYIVGAYFMIAGVLWIARALL
jgi:uncharacterized membrane protein HdeD (DUF308 family)